MNRKIYKSIDIEGFKLVYYLLDNINNSGYGVEIEKLLEDNIQEKKAIYDICIEKDEIYILLEKIVKGTVTPITLYDIVYDWINEREYI